MIVPNPKHAALKTECSGKSQVSLILAHFGNVSVSLTQDGWFCNAHQEAFYAYRLAHPDCPWKPGRPKALDNLSVDGKF